MTVIDARPFIAIGIAFLAALLVSMSNKYPNIRETWSAVGSITMFGVIISMVGGVLDGVTYEYTLFHLTDTVGLTMRVDPAGMIFAALASMLWIPINFYSIGYMRNNHEGMQTGYFAAFALCIGATMGIAMVGFGWLAIHRHRPAWRVGEGEDCQVRRVVFKRCSSRYAVDVELQVLKRVACKRSGFLQYQKPHQILLFLQPLHCLQHQIPVP